MINDLRRAAAQRRVALDCDSATARSFDAAAALEEAHTENAALLAALNEARVERDNAEAQAELQRAEEDVHRHLKYGGDLPAAIARHRSTFHDMLETVWRGERDLTAIRQNLR